MPRPRRAVAAVALLPLLLASCSMTPEYRAPEVVVPAAWDGAGQDGAVPAPTAAARDEAEAWWRRFGNTELTSLVEMALSANQDIAAAEQRIAQARAALRSAGASLSPTLDGSGGLSRLTAGDGASDADTAWSGSLRASWELDLWGGIRAAVDAARFGVDRARFEREATALTVQAEVADAYVLALALKDRLRIAADNLDAARQTLTLVETRVTEGLSPPLELAQQQATVATIEANIPALQRQLRAAETALAVLTGRPPQGVRVAGTSLSELALPAPAAGQPADLLVRRPDIRAAEASLRAANADIGAARAAFLPSVTLSLTGGVSGVLTGGTTTALDLASGVAATIFSGGRLEGALEQAEATEAELIAGYRQSLLTAFKDVEDALVAADSSARRTDLLTVAADRAREATRVSREQYVAGTADFLAVLDSQRSQLSAEDSLVQADSDRFSAGIGLFRALGGSWQTDP